MHTLPRSHISEKLTNEQWKRIDDFSSPFILTFFRNVDYLRRRKGVSLEKMIKEIKAETGIGVGINAIKNYLDGKYVSAHVRYLTAWCIYFGEPLDKMLSVDYSLLKDK